MGPDSIMLRLHSSFVKLNNSNHTNILMAVDQLIEIIPNITTAVVKASGNLKK